MPRQYDPRKLKKETPREKKVADEYQQSRLDWARNKKITGVSPQVAKAYKQAFGKK